MTQPIDPTMWPKVEGRYPKTGTYFRVKSNGETWAGFFQKEGLITTCNGDGFGIGTYGPITFATDKNMPQVIDLSHFDLSKIEAKKRPDKPGLWHLSKSTNGFPDTNIFVSQELFDHPSDWDDGEYRFLCDFIPPRQSPAIPPKPKNVLHLMRLTRKVAPDDGEVGDMQWCVRDSHGDFRLIDGGESLEGRWWVKSQCEPVTE